MATLTGQRIKDSYKDLLQVSNSNSGIDSTLRAVSDGEATDSVLQLSSAAVNISSAGALQYAGVAITSTAAELNILDGATITVSELNILDGVTATATEINLLDGVTATTSELNILDGVTATASELNILDGVTATASELNIMDGVTATTAELNYVDGVTSNIQTQLDSKISATLTQEQVEDFVGGMLDGTETGISVSYDDTDGNIDFVVATQSDNNFTTTLLNKLNAIEASADVTDTSNVTSAGALMDSEVTNLSLVKGLTSGISSGNVLVANSAVADNDFLKIDGTSVEGRTAAEVRSDLNVEDGATADQTNAEIRTAVEAASDSNVFTDDDHSKLNAIEASADVTDTANVTSAGALMDSELTSIADVKALDQSVVSGATPTFTTTNFTDASNKRLMTDAQETKLDSVESNATADQTDEEIQDVVGAMFSSNTETGITATYQDGDGTIDIVVGTLNQDTTGTAAKVTVSDSTANTNFPVVFHDESNALLDDTGALRYNPSSGTLLVPNLSVAGTTTTVDTVTMEASNAIIFEGATADANETTLSIVDPTGDRTINLPNVSGTIPVLAAASTTQISSTPEELNILDGVTSTAAELNILDGVTSTAAELNILDGATVVVGEINYLDLGSTAVGTAIASKAVVLDSNKDYTGIRNLTITGELDGGSLDISGDADIDGTLETDALSINGTAVSSTAAELNVLDGYTGSVTELNYLDTLHATGVTATEFDYLDGVTSNIQTQLNAKIEATLTTEQVQDIVGAMFSSNTETRISATYEDGDGTIDLVVDDMTADTNTQLSDEQVQDIVGAMVSSNTETGIAVTYQDGDGTLDFVVATLNQDTTGNAATATALETARTIHGVSFDGTANIDLSEVVQDTAGGMFSSNTETFITATYQDADGTVDLVVPVLDEDDLSSDSASHLVTQQSVKAYIDAQVAASGSGDITAVTFQTDSGSGSKASDTGGSADFSLLGGDGIGITNSGTTITAAVAAAQTTITSLLATDIKIGEDDQTKIDFETADEIHFYAANVEQVYLGDNIFGPQSDSDVDLGSSSVRWKDAYVDSITVTGEVDGASLDISADADIDGTLEADAITIGGVTLAETISDTVGAMVGSNTESGITVAYQDADNTLDFTVGTLNQDTTGSAATLTTARNIGGVSFDGSANINLPGVNTGGNQDTSGNAATATALETARNIGGVSFDGTGNINLPGVNTAGNQDTTGNAATATALATARNIHGVSFDGTGNIDLSEVIQDTVGAMFSSNTETRITATYQDADGTIDLVVDDLDTDTQLSTENVQDIVGAMFSSNTETRISATYQDGDGTIDLAVDDMTANDNTNQLTTFQLEDGDGTEVTIAHGKEIKFVEGGGIDINFTDTSTGSDGDPFDLTFTVSSQTDNNFTNADHSKLDGIEPSADVCDATNVTAAGALMDSECTNLSAVKGINQALTTSSDVQFAAVTQSSFVMDGNTISGIDDSGEFTNNDSHIMTSAAVEDKILGYGYTTNTGDMTGVDLTGANGIEITSESNTGSGNYSATINISHLGIEDLSDPGADRLLIWDDSAGAVVFATPNSNLAISGTNVNATDTNTNTTYSAGTNISLSGTTFNVDDAFLKNNADDTTSGTITAAGYNTASGKIGDVDDEYIDFGTAGEIQFKIDNVEDFMMADGGTFHANADIIAYSSSISSDKRLKKNIKDVKYGLEDILKLRGVEFDWKEKLDGKHDIGFIAQEVQEVVPELVKEVDGLNDEEAHLVVDYAKLVPVLVESIKELKAEIEELKK